LKVIKACGISFTFEAKHFCPGTHFEWGWLLSEIGLVEIRDLDNIASYDGFNLGKWCSSFNKSEQMVFSTLKKLFYFLQNICRACTASKMEI